jgi:hypothetical protein
VDAVKRWRYEPAKYKATAVPFAMFLRITFRLR